MIGRDHPAVDLARIILDDSEDEHPTALYVLTVHEARTLAHAALAADRVEELADEFDADAATCAIDPDLDPSYADGARDTAARIRTALNGEADD